MFRLLGRDMQRSRLRATSPRYATLLDALPHSALQEEEDYEKAIKESLVGTANRDASGEPLDPNERKRQNGMYVSSLIYALASGR